MAPCPTTSTAPDDVRLDVQLDARPDAVALRSRALVDAGADRLSTFEGPHDVFLPLAVAAQEVEADLMTNVAIAMPRSPVHLAHAAWDLQLASRGRFRLGLGSQVRVHVEKRYGATWSPPAARMREIVSAVRAILTSWQDGTRLDFRGEHTRHTLMPPTVVPGPNPYGAQPVLLGALGPLMTRTAAEVADGLLVMPFHSHRHVRERTLPAVAAGLAAAGRAEVPLYPQAIVAMGRTAEEQAAADAGVSRLLALYGSRSAYRPVLDIEGWGDLQPRLNALSKTGDVAAMTALVTPAMVETLAVRGTPSECAAELHRRFGDLTDRVCCYFPGYDLPLASLTELRAALRQPSAPSSRRTSVTPSHHLARTAGRREDTHDEDEAPRPRPDDGRGGRRDSAAGDRSGRRQRRRRPALTNRHRRGGVQPARLLAEVHRPGGPRHAGALPQLGQQVVLRPWRRSRRRRLGRASAVRLLPPILTRPRRRVGGPEQPDRCGCCTPVRIEIWSDVVCPWCYIGKRRLEEALAGFEHRDEVDVVWRSFQLDPSAPTEPHEHVAEMLGRTYGRSPAEVEQMQQQMLAVAAEVGLDFGRHGQSLHLNTVDAHRLLHAAGARRGELKEALLHAYFVEARNLADHDVLVEVAASVGLDADDARAVLSSDAHADDVAADVAQATAYGATGVPFFVIDARYGVSGVQPTEVFAQLLEQAWAERSPVQLVPAGDATAPGCEGDVCAT